MTQRPANRLRNGVRLSDGLGAWLLRRKEIAMKSQMRMEFEARHGFEVCDDMDIQTSVAWDNWKEAWKAAMAHARYKANECADNNAYTPAQKRALGAWLQRVALTVEDEAPNAALTGAAKVD